MFVLKHKPTPYIYLCVCVCVFCVLWYLIIRPALHMLVFMAAILIFNDVCIHMYCISFILDYRIRITHHFVWFICNFMLLCNMHPENYSCCCEHAFSKTGICFIIKWRFRSKQDNQQLEFKESFNEKNDNTSATHQTKSLLLCRYVKFLETQVGITLKL